MTNKAEAYRETLRRLADWEPFLLAESGLPGPRGNIELANVAADEGDESTFRRMLAYDPPRAPANSPKSSWHSAASLVWASYWPKGSSRS